MKSNKQPTGFIVYNSPPDERPLSADERRYVLIIAAVLIGLSVIGVAILFVVIAAAG